LLDAGDVESVARQLHLRLTEGQIGAMPRRKPVHVSAHAAKSDRFPAT
jgi:hypothetical protein